MGRSRGGLTTKIHMLADALGRPLRFIVTAGQVGDATQAKALLEGQSGAAVLADKAYDSNALRETIAAMKAKAVIPSNRTRKVIIPHDAEAYRHRNRIDVGHSWRLSRIRLREVGMVLRWRQPSPWWWCCSRGLEFRDGGGVGVYKLGRATAGCRNVAAG